jgi:hypothetical protein
MGVAGTLEYFSDLLSNLKRRRKKKQMQTVALKVRIVVLNSINLEGQGRQPPAVTAQPPTGQPPAASHQLFAATAASRLHT